MHWFQCCPPGWVTCIATLPGIALLALSVSIDLVSSSARVTSVKFQQGVLVCDGGTSGPKDRTPGLPGSDKNQRLSHLGDIEAEQKADWNHLGAIVYHNLSRKAEKEEEN